MKTTKDREALWEALLDDRIDVIATDHAPHTREEKANLYPKAPSGGPLVQHAVVALMEAYHKGKISIEKLVEKMAHNPAILFQIENQKLVRFKITLKSFSFISYLTTYVKPYLFVRYFIVLS